MNGRRLFTPGRCAVAGSCLVASAITGQPRTLYLLFAELGSPRAGALALGAGAILASLPHGPASRMQWVRGLNRSIEAGPALRVHDRRVVVACRGLLFAAAIGLAVTIWGPSDGGIAEPFRDWLRSEDGFWETVTAAALLGGGGLFLHLGLTRGPQPRSPRWISIFIGLLLVLGAAEELSWGQRFLGFDTPAMIRELNVQEEANLHNVGGYWANYLLMIGFFLYVGCLPLIEHVFIDVRAAVAAVGIPVPPMEFAPYGLFGAFLGDHPLLIGLWQPVSWRLSEAREVLFGLVMLGVAFDAWLVARAGRRGTPPASSPSATCGSPGTRPSGDAR